MFNLFVYVFLYLLQSNDIIAQCGITMLKFLNEFDMPHLTSELLFYVMMMFGNK